MPENISDTEIHAYLDQQLTPEQAREFELRLKKDAIAQKKLSEYQLIQQSLNRLYQPILEDPVPSQLLNICQKKSFNYLAIAASLLFFVVGWLSGSHINPVSNASNNSLLVDLETPAIFAHRVYSVEKLHPVEVRADQQQHLNHWLSKRLKTKLKAPDLRSHQFEIVGGRLLPSTNERMAAQFMYQNNHGQRLTLYIRRGHWKNKETTFIHSQKTVQGNSFTVSYWVDGDLGYVVTGEFDPQINQQISESIYRQMSLNITQFIALR